MQEQEQKAQCWLLLVCINFFCCAYSAYFLKYPTYLFLTFNSELFLCQKFVGISNSNFALKLLLLLNRVRRNVCLL